MDVTPFVSVSLLVRCVLKWDGLQPGVVTRSFVPGGSHALPNEGLDAAATANVPRLYRLPVVAPKTSIHIKFPGFAMNNTPNA